MYVLFEEIPRGIFGWKLLSKYHVVFSCVVLEYHVVFLDGNFYPNTTWYFLKLKKIKIPRGIFLCGKLKYHMVFTLKKLSSLSEISVG
jgi:hypothetical protein